MYTWLNYYELGSSSLDETVETLQPPIEPGVSCLLVAVRCSSAACSALSAYRWWEQQISGCILLGASGSSILQGCLRVSNKNRQPNHAAGSSNKLHVQKYGSASPHLTRPQLQPGGTRSCTDGRLHIHNNAVSPGQPPPPPPIEALLPAQPGLIRG